MATNALPSVSKLREIVRLLAFDTDQIPLQGMTTDRQRTALAATAVTVLLAKLNNHLLDVDQLNEAERYMLSTSPVADVTSGDGPAVALLLETYQRAHEIPGIELGGTVYLLNTSERTSTINITVRRFADPTLRLAAQRDLQRLVRTDEGGEMPPIISRGFRGRRDDAPSGRVPPGQYLTRDFPVLSAGPTPHRPLELWDFSIVGEIDEPRRWTWEEFRALPSEEVTVDIHCVTKWSKLDTVWQGVSVDTLLDGVETAAEYVVQFSDGGYTTNLPLDDVTGGKAWVAFAYDGEPLEPEHGGPARILVPHLYFWKSAKWVRGLRLSATDEPGFWEVNGYHNYGDPWQEQRYWGD
jgi:DMSO/TMAO reductase YedYZ molybdopterin-dependent catalytic subunit